jgi:hypothetical protein
VAKFKPGDRVIDIDGDTGVVVGLASSAPPEVYVVLYATIRRKPLHHPQRLLSLADDLFLALSARVRRLKRGKV